MKKNQTKPLLSVITVCYNEEDNMGKTCRSVYKQTSENFEWIVIDGKSTDNTLEIIKKYKKKISSLISENDKGVYDAMNKGISKAKGRYLLFLNGGDMLKNKDVLKKVSKYIKEDSEKSSIYYGDLYYDNGEIVTFKKSKLNKNFFVKKTISHQATFIKRKLFQDYGKYNTKYKITADFDFWVKAIIMNKVKTKYIPMIISVFDLSGISTNYKLAKKQIKERNEVLINYKLINQTEAKLAEKKWLLLIVLKKLRVYNNLRKIYRSAIKR